MSAIAAPGSFAWLVRHEVRLAWRGRAKGNRRIIALLLIALYVAFGAATAYGLMGVPIAFNAWFGVIVLAGSIAALSFMTTQAILGGQQTLYESRDLDLLFTAPIDPRRVLLAKLAGIAGVIALTYAMLLLPMVVPIALFGHPGLFGVIGMLAALAMTGAAIGVAVTLLLARIAGPRAARTVGQVAAAMMGGALFLITQLSRGEPGRSGTFGNLFTWFRSHGYGAAGWSGVPGHAAFGYLLPLAAMLALGVVLFAGVGGALQRLFLSGYQDATMSFSRARPTGKDGARLFHAGLFRPVLAKEWRLLRRDPALLFQVLLRIVYMAPLVLWAFHGDGRLIAPGLAFASVLVATQLAGSFAWLTVSGEDAPDLIAVAPTPKARVDMAKLTAALLMAAPFAAVIPIALAVAARNPIAGLIALAMAAAGGSLAGLIELKLGKPGQRATFAKRRQGGFIAGLLGLVVAVMFGGGAGALVYFLT